MKKLLFVLMFLPFIGFGQCVSGDCQNGYGTFTSEEGTYKGYWKDGKVHGNGVFKGSDYTYNGEYINGKKHGQGKMTYINGKTDEGLFENNKFVKAASGCVYGDCENGYGTYEWPAGDKYSGNWKYGKRNGYGTYTWANGDKYAGNLKNNEKHGQGTYTWANGKKVTGEWLYDEYQEEETSTTSSKSTYSKPSTTRYKSSYSSLTYSILSYDFNNNSPFNIRYSGGMYEDETGFYIGGGFKAGRTPTSSGIYEVENGQPIMYDGDATIGSFGPKIEESQSSYYIDAGITRHLFYAFWWSAGLAYERNLVVEKREHYFDHDNNGSNLADEYWGIEWLENKDESYHKVFIETDIYVKVFDAIAVKYGVSYKNGAINSVVGVGYAF